MKEDKEKLEKLLREVNREKPRGSCLPLFAAIAMVCVTVMVTAWIIWQ